jgi:glycosyltransferase involved in cell wall biosynthesis
VRLAFVLTGGLHPSGRYEVTPVWLTLLERLAARHEVHAFVVRHLKEPQSYTLNGFQVHDLGSPGRGGALGRAAQSRALRKAVRSHGPFDLMHGVLANPSGLLTVFAAKRLGIPSVVTCDSGEFTSIPSINYGLQLTATGRTISRVVCGMAKRIHVTTKYMLQLAMMNGWHPVRIPMGIDLALFPPRETPAEGPPWRLLKVGSLNHVKNQRQLIDAVALVRRELNVELDLVGEDTLGGALQAHAVSLGLGDHVHVHGFVPQDALAPFYARAHAYVQSSLHDAAAIAVLEATAVGVPVVGTNVGYVAEWAPNAAIAVPTDDAPALASAIVAVLRNPAREALAVKAREFVVEHDVEWTARAFEKLYQGITMDAIQQ